MCVYMLVAYLHTLPTSLLRSARGNDILVAMTSSAQTLSSKFHSPLKGTKAPWGKQLILGLEEKSIQHNKMNLDYLIVPEIKEILKKQIKAYQRDRGANPKELLMVPNQKTFSNITNTTLDDSSDYEMHIHYSYASLVM